MDLALSEPDRVTAHLLISKELGVVHQVCTETQVLNSELKRYFVHFISLHVY